MFFPQVLWVVLSSVHDGFFETFSERDGVVHLYEARENRDIYITLHRAETDTRVSQTAQNSNTACVQNNILNLQCTVCLFSTCMETQMI